MDAQEQINRLVWAIFCEIERDRLLQNIPGGGTLRFTIQDIRQVSLDDVTYSIGEKLQREIFEYLQRMGVFKVVDVTKQDMPEHPLLGDIFGNNCIGETYHIMLVDSAYHALYDNFKNKYQVPNKKESGQEQLPSPATQALGEENITYGKWRIKGQTIKYGQTEIQLQGRHMKMLRAIIVNTSKKGSCKAKELAGHLGIQIPSLREYKRWLFKTLPDSIKKQDLVVYKMGKFFVRE